MALAAFGMCVDILGNHPGQGRLSQATAACFTGGSQDSVTIYPVQQFVHYGSSSVCSFFDDYFMADTATGWRYVVELVKGSPAVSNAIITLNGQQFVGSSDL